MTQGGSAAICVKKVGLLPTKHLTRPVNCPIVELPSSDQMAPLPSPSRRQVETFLATSVLAQDWSALNRRYPNVLLVGGDALVSCALVELTHILRQPIARADAPSWTAPAGYAAGTLVLRDISGLSPEGQASLDDWLAGAGRVVQVVATNRVPVFDAVMTGAFRSSLYYRLNTLYFELGDDRLVATL
jgi:hypothetical protein